VQVPPFRSQGLADPTAHPAVVTPERHLIGPPVGLDLQVLDVGEHPQRQERGLQVPVGPLDLALGLGASRLEHMMRRPRWPHRAATSGCSRALRPTPSATIEESLSTTIASGTPPRRRKHPTEPCRKSAIVFEWLWPAEWGSVVTHP